METAFCIAVDVGNSRTDVGVVDRRNDICLRRDDFPTGQLLHRIPKVIPALLDAAGCTCPVPVIASCVVVKARENISSLIPGKTGCSLHWLEVTPNFPLELEYDNPRTIGADRLANLLFCHYRYPGQSCVAIDAGTAVTTDFLEDGVRFRGGLIMPGIAAQLAALHASTAALPALKAEDAVAHIPGQSTRECIEGGILYGIAGALGRHVSGMRGVQGKQIRVIASGGAWPVISPLVDFTCEYEPDMTLVGIGYFGRLIDV